MSGIRVTYAGLISLSVRLSSIITGLIFTLIVTRQLSQDEFGTWGVINGIFVYAVAIHPIITYWATRESARGEDSGRMVFLSSSGFSIIGLGIYLVLAFFISSQSDASEIACRQKNELSASPTSARRHLFLGWAAFRHRLQ